MEFVPAGGKGEQGFYCEQQEEEEDEQDLDLQILNSSSKGMLQSATIPASASSSSSNYYNTNNNKSHHLLQLSSSNGGRWGNSPQIYDQMQRSEHYFSFDGGAHQQPPGGDQLDRGGGDRVRGFLIEREHMFDKVVTPSDVGKLNRLVIPKQHAEKYFPLDSSNNEKGLLLNFEDRNGKSWRFRYSYWNSSQSYVMTKGWSRFVKDKKLDAGDIVSFHRGLGEFGKDLFYIDWRRRPDPPLHDPSASFHHHHRSSVPWSPLLFRAPAGTTSTVAYPRDHTYLTPHHWMSSSANYHHPYRNNHNGYGSYGHGAVVGVRGGSNYVYGNMRNANQTRSGGDRGDCGAEAMVLESVPVVQAKASTGKKLRLFGVNMECSISGGGSELDDCDVLESGTRAHATMVSQSPQLSSFSHPHLQLRLYNGTPLHLQPNNNDNKGKACSNSTSS